MPAIRPLAAVFPHPMPGRAAWLPRVAAAVLALCMVACQAAVLLADDHRAAALAFREAGWTPAELAAAAQAIRRCTLAQRQQRPMIAGTSGSPQVQHERNHSDDCRG